MIEELKRTMTTQQVIHCYRMKYGRKYLDALHEDMQHCTVGMRLAIETCLGGAWEIYMRNQPERPIDENKDIIGQMKGE